MRSIIFGLSAMSRRDLNSVSDVDAGNSLRDRESYFSICCQYGRMACSRRCCGRPMTSIGQYKAIPIRGRGDRQPEISTSDLPPGLASDRHSSDDAWEVLGPQDGVPPGPSRTGLSPGIDAFPSSRGYGENAIDIEILETSNFLHSPRSKSYDEPHFPRDLAPASLPGRRGASRAKSIGSETSRSVSLPRARPSRRAKEKG